MIDVYQKVTDRIIELLEAGTAPWHRPWKSMQGDGAMPKNLMTKREYRGINVWMLLASGFPSPYWLSFRQAKEYGGFVKAGEKSTSVVWFDVKKRAVEGEQESGDQDGRSKTYMLLRYYNVFNLTQCELPEKVLERIGNRRGEDLLAGIEPEGGWPIDSPELARAEAIIENMPQRPTIKHAPTAKPCYSKMLDSINMPTRGRFPKPEEYYSTLFHELTHSTGHGSRLDRDTLADICPFGSTNYSKEELVAEMGAAFLCGIAGIENSTIDNSASYLEGWLRKLKSDKKFIVSAAARAQKAADFILGRKRDEGGNGETRTDNS